MKIEPDKSSALELRFGGYSVAGRKPLNEDAFAAHQPSLGVRHFKGAVACIADGVSCSEHAQQASQTSVTQFIEDYYSTPDTWPVKTAAARVLSAMNSWFYHYGQKTALPHNGMVTTFSAVICKSTTLHLFHVGDSRIYRMRQGVLEQLSRDHSHKQVGRKVFLTRALGMDTRLEVDYLQEEMQLGDLLILSTDGLHEFLKPTDWDLLQQLNENARNDLEALAKRLVNCAHQNGSEDNISCLLLDVLALPKEEIDEVHRQLTQLKIPPVMKPGMSIDGFDILDTIHSGSRSHLYLAQNNSDGHRYVLKAPSENFAEDPQYLEGFIREQWVGRRLDSARVMKIYPRPENSPFLYHVCEHIQGQSLRQWMYDNPQPALAQVRDFVKNIIGALRVFQRMSMVHRDLKPENIMLDHHLLPKIIDFGTVSVSGLEEIASALQEDVPVGSVDYIAPECVLGERGQSNADIFSLGVITYEMLSGKLPYKSHSATSSRRLQDWRYRSIRDVRPDIPEWLDLTLAKAVAADPNKRYQAFSEFEQDLLVPNVQMLEKRQNAPLIERNPLGFWQWVSGLLALTVLLQSIFIAKPWL